MPFTDWETTDEKAQSPNSNDDYSSEDTDGDQENADLTPENFKSRDDGKPSPRTILRKLSKPKMTDGRLTGDTRKHGDSITDETAISAVNSRAKKTDGPSPVLQEHTSKKMAKIPNNTTQKKNCTSKSAAASDDESDSEDESASSASSSDSDEDDAQEQGTIEHSSNKSEQHENHGKNPSEEETLLMSSATHEVKHPAPLEAVPEKSTTVSTSATAGKGSGASSDKTKCTESKSEVKSVPESRDDQSSKKPKSILEDIHHVILNDNEDGWEKIHESSKLIMGKPLVCEEPNDVARERNLLDDLKEDDTLDLEWYYDVDGKRYIGYTTKEEPVVYMYPVSVKDEIAFWEQVCVDVPFKGKQHKFQISMYLTLGELLTESGSSHIAKYLFEEAICTTMERRILSHAVKCHMANKSTQKNPKRKPPTQHKNETPKIKTFLASASSVSQSKPSRPHQKKSREPKYVGQRDHLNSEKRTQEEESATTPTLGKKRKREADKSKEKQKQKKLVQKSLQEVTNEISEREKGSQRSNPSSDTAPSKESTTEKRKRGTAKKKSDDQMIKKMKAAKILIDDTPQTDERKKSESDVDSRGKPQESARNDTILFLKEISVEDAIEALKKAADKLGYNVAIKFESKDLGSNF